MRRLSWTLFAAGALFAELPAIPVARDASGALTTIALFRTPPLYATDAPAKDEILSVDLRIIDAGGKREIRLAWRDPTRDDAALPAARNAWQSDKPLAQSEATNRFFDGCAVMVPARPVADGVYPSLQMGDADHPVIIYYFDVVRGASIMAGNGRGTTHRTGKVFAARAAYQNGGWQVTMELPELPSGTPVALAVWNGSQQDRDGRKYFSIWHRIQ